MSGLIQLQRSSPARKAAKIIAGGRVKLRVRDGLLLRAVRTAGARNQNDERGAR